MDYAAVLDAANSLSLDDRIRLVEAVSQAIDTERGPFELSEELKQELDRRMAAYEASPEKALPWEVVKARALARLNSNENQSCCEGVTVEYASVFAAAKSLDLEDRLRLAEALWEEIESEKTELPDELKQELLRRLEAHKASPDAGIPWEQVEAEALARWKR